MAAIPIQVIPFNGSSGDASNTTTTTGEQTTKPTTVEPSGRPEYKNEKFLRYPYKRIENNFDYLQIQIAEYVPADLAASFSNLFSQQQVEIDGKKYIETSLGEKATFRLETISERIGGTFAPNSDGKNIKHTICLPIPETITDASSISWGDGDTLNPAEAFGLGFASKFGDDPAAAFSNVLGELRNATGKLIFDENTKKLIQTAISGAAVGALGGNVSASSIISRATGQVFNPNLELLFDGVGLRTFPFTFDIFPRSKREAEEVKSIIRCLKRSMAARKNSSGNAALPGAFIGTPDIFQLRYMRGNDPHPFLNKFLPTALIDMQLNYTASNTYSTFWDGTPTHMQMTLSFRELNPIYSEDYDDLYNVGDTSVGY